MGHLRWAVLLAVFATQVAAIELQIGLNGSWWHARQDGQGFVIHLIPEANQIFVAWFTYTPDGSEQMWITGSGSLDDHPIQLDLRQSLGGALNASPPVPDSVSWGQASLQFSSCRSAVFRYSGSARGEIPLERLTPAIACQDGPSR